MEEFYESVRNRVQGVETAEGRQKTIIELYDKFFKTAFPKPIIIHARYTGSQFRSVHVVSIVHSAVEGICRYEHREKYGQRVPTV